MRCPRQISLVLCLMFGRVVPASQLGPTLRHGRCLQGITAGVAAGIDKAGVCRGSAGNGVCLLGLAGSLASRELDAEQTEHILRQSSILCQLNAPAVHVSTDMYLHSFARYGVGHLEGRPYPAEVFQGSVQGSPRVSARGSSRAVSQWVLPWRFKFERALANPA